MRSRWVEPDYGVKPIKIAVPMICRPFFIFTLFSEKRPRHEILPTSLFLDKTLHDDCSAGWNQASSKFNKQEFEEVYKNLDHRKLLTRCGFFPELIVVGSK